MTVSLQDPPNGALECKVNGVATTTVITITAPVLMTDESGAMTLDYDVELVGMTRGGPTVFNTTASAESVDDGELVCDDGSGVSLYIDNAAPDSCPSPMTSCLPSTNVIIAGACYPGLPEVKCADNWSLHDASGGGGLPYCVPQ